jgi:hypothetical protein
MNLEATPENTSEAEADKGEEEDDNGDSNDLDLPPVYGRASVIARQLKEKRACNSILSKY